MKSRCSCGGRADDSHGVTCAIAIEEREAPDRAATRKALAAVARAHTRLTEAEASLREIRARRMILCGCEALHTINELALRVTHWYEGPHGCIGGDYWVEGEWQFVCPVSGAFNRLLFRDYDVQHNERQKFGVAAEPTFKRLYRDLFASNIDIHERHMTGPTYNNYYVDQRRDYYELPARPGGRDVKR